jgi:uncharacterized membrane-anchored protein
MNTTISTTSKIITIIVILVGSLMNLLMNNQLPVTMAELNQSSFWFEQLNIIPVAMLLGIIIISIQMIQPTSAAKTIK